VVLPILGVAAGTAGNYLSLTCDPHGVSLVRPTCRAGSAVAEPRMTDQPLTGACPNADVSRCGPGCRVTTAAEPGLLRAVRPPSKLVDSGSALL
jgi:hypothetical protein